MKKCPVSEYCGGCQYQGIDYEKQLERKQESVNKLLSCFHDVNPIIGCRDSLHYRNKMQVSFACDEKKRIIFGYYVPKTHTVVPVDECMLCEKGISEILSSVKKILIRHHIPIYDEAMKKGCLRYIQIRSSNQGEYMLILVTASVSLPKADLLVRDILKAHPEIRSIIHNVNRKSSSDILGEKNTILYGKGYITDELCGLSFRISPSSFYQVNRIQTEVLYNEAIRSAAFKGDEILIDAYCGIGTIGLSAAKHVKEVIGVESNASAIRDAQNNCRINKIANARFICEDAGRYMEYLSRNKTHIDTVIMDPPRGGSDSRFISSMVKMKPEHIIYISCNPVTLKRDLSDLNRSYQVDSIQPVDMFPFTKHIEVIAVLSRKKAG